MTDDRSVFIGPRKEGELELAVMYIKPIPHYASKRRFSSGASEALQDSAAPPSVWGMCRSAARSYLFRLASETRVVWNRDGLIFDVWRLVLTNQSKSRGGATPVSCRNIKTR